MPHALCIRSGALREALQETRGDKVSGAKLVVYIDAIPFPNYMPLSSQSHPRRAHESAEVLKMCLNSTFSPLPTRSLW